MAVNDGGAQFVARLNEIAASTETLLDQLLGPGPVPHERARPARLLEAMRYGSLGGGKRFRPFLVVESAALFAVPRERALMAGAALECVHCYSLVHDDMPAMDNDDLRRGRPTVHKAFDDATAILVGDSLLTFAFDILARTETHRIPQSASPWSWRSRAPPASAEWRAGRCSILRPKGGLPRRRRGSASPMSRNCRR